MRFTPRAYRDGGATSATDVGYHYRRVNIEGPCYDKRREVIEMLNGWYPTMNCSGSSIPLTKVTTGRPAGAGKSQPEYRGVGLP